MARYIDADALIKKIYPMGIGDGKYTINAKAVKLAIDNAPTADVVPKSEVERLEHLRAELSKEVADLQDALKCEKETNKHLSEEYISAQKEIARLEKASLPPYCQAVSEEEAIKIGKEYGRTEVAREIFLELDKILRRSQTELIGQKFYIRCITDEHYSELKKKYIGE